MQKVTESLAGRIAILTLLPFSLFEVLQVHPQLTLADWLYTGGYPEVVVNPKINPQLWMNSYLQTYLERDVRNIRQVGDLQQFQRFLKHTAARSSQLLNYSDISRDLGVSVPTVKQWISVLQASHIVYLMPPYYRNLGKRQVKSPKLYFLDTGLMAALLEYQSGREILNGPMAGAFFETAVVSELVKHFYNQARPPSLYFWRTRTGQEIDVVIETNGKVTLIEIKLTASPTHIHINQIKKVKEVFSPEQVDQALLICTVPETTPLPHNIRALSWKNLATFKL
ncbi:MAG: DUF4143 domain-containing protein [Methanobacteriota archaeon]|nr:MAG: DUF4143 domain-containing protein [Euryarchaeota archaeon]